MFKKKKNNIYSWTKSIQRTTTTTWSLFSSMILGFFASLPLVVIICIILAILLLIAAVLFVLFYRSAFIPLFNASVKVPSGIIAHEYNDNTVSFGGKSTDNILIDGINNVLDKVGKVGDGKNSLAGINSSILSNVTNAIKVSKKPSNGFTSQLNTNIYTSFQLGGVGLNYVDVPTRVCYGVNKMIVENNGGSVEMSEKGNKSEKSGQEIIEEEMNKQYMLYSLLYENTAGGKPLAEAIKTIKGHDKTFTNRFISSYSGNIIQKMGDSHIWDIPLTNENGVYKVPKNMTGNVLKSYQTFQKRCTNSWRYNNWIQLHFVATNSFMLTDEGNKVIHKNATKNDSITPIKEVKEKYNKLFSSGVARERDLADAYEIVSTMQGGNISDGHFRKFFLEHIYKNNIVFNGEKKLSLLETMENRAALQSIGEQSAFISYANNMEGLMKELKKIKILKGYISGKYSVMDTSPLKNIYQTSALHGAMPVYNPLGNNNVIIERTKSDSTDSGFFKLINGLSINKNVVGGEKRALIPIDITGYLSKKYGDLYNENKTIVYYAVPMNEKDVKGLTIDRGSNGNYSILGQNPLSFNKMTGGSSNTSILYKGYHYDKLKKSLDSFFEKVNKISKNYSNKKLQQNELYLKGKYEKEPSNVKVCIVEPISLDERLSVVNQKLYSPLVHGMQYFNLRVPGYVNKKKSVTICYKINNVFLKEDIGKRIDGGEKKFKASVFQLGLANTVGVSIVTENSVFNDEYRENMSRDERINTITSHTLDSLKTKGNKVVMFNDDVCLATLKYDYDTNSNLIEKANDYTKYEKEGVIASGNIGEYVKNEKDKTIKHYKSVGLGKSTSNTKNYTKGESGVSVKHMCVNLKSGYIFENHISTEKGRANDLFVVSKNFSDIKKGDLFSGMLKERTEGVVGGNSSGEEYMKKMGEIYFFDNIFALSESVNNYFHLLDKQVGETTQVGYGDVNMLIRENSLLEAESSESSMIATLQNDSIFMDDYLKGMEKDEKSAILKSLNKIAPGISQERKEIMAEMIVKEHKELYLDNNKRRAGKDSLLAIYDIYDIKKELKGGVINMGLYTLNRYSYLLDGYLPRRGSYSDDSFLDFFKVYKAIPLVASYDQFNTKTVKGGFNVPGLGFTSVVVDKKNQTLNNLSYTMPKDSLLGYSDVSLIQKGICTEKDIKDFMIYAGLYANISKDDQESARKRIIKKGGRNHCIDARGYEGYLNYVKLTLNNIIGTKAEGKILNKNMMFIKDKKIVAQKELDGIHGLIDGLLYNGVSGGFDVLVKERRNIDLYTPRIFINPIISLFKKKPSNDGSVMDKVLSKNLAFLENTFHNFMLISNMRKEFFNISNEEHLSNVLNKNYSNNSEIHKIVGTSVSQTLSDDGRVHMSLYNDVIHHGTSYINAMYQGIGVLNNSIESDDGACEDGRGEFVSGWRGLSVNSDNCRQVYKALKGVLNGSVENYTGSTYSPERGEKRSPSYLSMMETVHKEKEDKVSETFKEDFMNTYSNRQTSIDNLVETMGFPRYRVAGKENLFLDLFGENKDISSLNLTNKLYHQGTVLVAYETIKNAKNARAYTNWIKLDTILNLNKKMQSKYLNDNVAKDLKSNAELGMRELVSAKRGKHNSDEEIENYMLQMEKSIMSSSLLMDHVNNQFDIARNFTNGRFNVYAVRPLLKGKSEKSLGLTGGFDELSKKIDEYWKERRGSSDEYNLFINKYNKGAQIDVYSKKRLNRSYNGTATQTLYSALINMFVSSLGKKETHEAEVFIDMLGLQHSDKKGLLALNEFSKYSYKAVSAYGVPRISGDLYNNIGGREKVVEAMLYFVGSHDKKYITKSTVFDTVSNIPITTKTIWKNELIENSKYFYQHNPDKEKLSVSLNTIASTYLDSNSAWNNGAIWSFVKMKLASNPGEVKKIRRDTMDLFMKNYFRTQSAQHAAYGEYMKREHQKSLVDYINVNSLLIKQFSKNSDMPEFKKDIDIGDVNEELIAKSYDITDALQINSLGILNNVLSKKYMAKNHAMKFNTIESLEQDDKLSIISFNYLSYRETYDRLKDISAINKLIGNNESFVEEAHWDMFKEVLTNTTLCTNKGTECNWIITKAQKAGSFSELNRFLKEMLVSLKTSGTYEELKNIDGERYKIIEGLVKEIRGSVGKYIEIAMGEQRWIGNLRDYLNKPERCSGPDNCNKSKNRGWLQSSGTPGAGAGAGIFGECAYFSSLMASLQSSAGEIPCWFNGNGNTIVTKMGSGVPSSKCDSSFTIDGVQFGKGTNNLLTFNRGKIPKKNSIGGGGKGFGHTFYVVDVDPNDPYMAMVAEMNFYGENGFRVSYSGKSYPGSCRGSLNGTYCTDYAPFVSVEWKRLSKVYEYAYLDEIIIDGKVVSFDTSN